MMATKTQRQSYDLVVIGAGAAGLVTAVGASFLGVRTALIEKNRFGGECLWTGCVPSKALIRTAQTLHDARSAADVGLSSSQIPADFASIMASMRQVIARIEPHDDPETLRGKGVTPIHGTARILGPGRIAVDGEELHTRKTVIATGSRPIIPPIAGLAETGYLTHESILELRERPARLVVIGAGPIGLEFAQIFNRLGTEVSVVELADTILPREDAELSAQLCELMKGEGIRFFLRHKAVAASATAAARQLALEGPDGTSVALTGEHLLVATGMRPFTGSLGLETAGVQLEDGGAVRVDAKLRTSAPDIWAAGDVTGKLFFTHVADYQARLLVRNMFFPLRSRADYSRVPWAIYTDPALARIGLTEDEARARHGDSIGVYRYPFHDLDRAITDRAAHGLAKIITDRRGRLLGAHILGSHADTMIHEVAVAMHAGLKIGRLSQIVHAYPTWSEALRRTGDAFYRERFAQGWIPKLLRWWARR